MNGCEPHEFLVWVGVLTVLSVGLFTLKGVYHALEYWVKQVALGVAVNKDDKELINRIIGLEAEISFIKGTYFDQYKIRYTDFGTYSTDEVESEGVTTRVTKLETQLSNMKKEVYDKKSKKQS